MPTQNQVDGVVSRIKTLIARYGATSPELAKLGSRYRFFAACPGDNFGFVLLEMELDETERALATPTARTQEADENE